MSNLQLSLKTKWFEMTKAGIKSEDYREINCYWSKRLIYNLKDVLLHKRRYVVGGFVNDKDAYDFLTGALNNFGFNDFETNTMTLGYPKTGDTERIIQFEHAGIEIRTGNPDWGAEPGKLYFVIKHGKQI